jgi:hypothetical protein
MLLRRSRATLATSFALAGLFLAAGSLPAQDGPTTRWVLGAGLGVQGATSGVSVADNPGAHVTFAGITPMGRRVTGRAEVSLHGFAAMGHDAMCCARYAEGASAIGTVGAAVLAPGGDRGIVPRVYAVAGAGVYTGVRSGETIGTRPGVNAGLGLRLLGGAARAFTIEARIHRWTGDLEGSRWLAPVTLAVAW